jgi:hypothetical protein
VLVSRELLGLGTPVWSLLSFPWQLLRDFVELATRGRIDEQSSCVPMLWSFLVNSWCLIHPSRRMTWRVCSWSAML